MFSGRPLLIATQHHKEKVLTPLLETHLQVKCMVPDHYDTDVFGTFSGEIVRKADPLSTARKKCLEALERFGGDLGIASEGSFGPHPDYFFLPADEELLVFIDLKNQLEIVARHLSTNTNFSGIETNDEAALLSFAAKARFPEHALILKSGDNIIKGINNSHVLLENFHELLQKSNSVKVETDMRAMHNPLRMEAISEACKKLIEKISSTCPQCQTPGFDVSNVIRGLPCRRCYSPTRSVMSLVYSCKKCHYSEEKKHPNHKNFEEPTFCDLCNP